MKKSSEKDKYKLHCKKYTDSNKLFDWINKIKNIKYLTVGTVPE